MSRKIDCTPGPNAFSTFTVAVPLKLSPSGAPLVTGPCTAITCNPRKFALPAMRHVKCPCADPSPAITAAKPKCDPSTSPSPSRSAPKVVVPPPVTCTACADGAAARSLDMAGPGAAERPGGALAPGGCAYFFMVRGERPGRKGKPPKAAPREAPPPRPPATRIEGLPRPTTRYVLWVTGIRAKRARSREGDLRKIQVGARRRDAAG